MRILRPPILSVAVLVFAAFSPSVVQAQLVFNFTDVDNLKTKNPAAYNGIVQAAGQWSSVFSDSMTVNVRIAMRPLRAEANAATRPIYDDFSYADVRQALLGDITSQDDISSTLALPIGSSVDMLLNFTSNNPYGPGSGTFYLDNDGDANNSRIRMTMANAKALGLFEGGKNDRDATIIFNSNRAFDFDPANGIAKDQIDFVGVATHELGHVLGFDSGVDVLDSKIPDVGTDDTLMYVSTLDLFRFSKASVRNRLGVIDWTVDNRIKYFSVDGGATSIAEFSRGKLNARGFQASHWDNNINIGIMAPGSGVGQQLKITRNDLRAFDVIGYDLITPEPGAWALIGACMLATIGVRKRPRMM